MPGKGSVYKVHVGSIRNTCIIVALLDKYVNQVNYKKNIYESASFQILILIMKNNFDNWIILILMFQKCNFLLTKLVQGIFFTIIISFNRDFQDL